MNYKAWYALGELVDNSIDSYLRTRDRIIALEGESYQFRIVIEIDPRDGGTIRVWDNAGGIEATNYERAFVTAEPPANSAGLSQFGIGMKSASCWFARNWRVNSTALGEDVEREIEFDVPRIVQDKLESIEPKISSADVSKHFTEVRLWNLYKPPWTRTLGKMRTHLEGMYRQFLRDGDVHIILNGEELFFEEPKVLRAPYFRDHDGPPRLWERQVNFTLSTGERVNGFVAIREKGNTREAGLALFRHRRLIVGSADETYRPAEIFGGTNSFTYQRVFGELDLDDFDVSHTKDSFIWGEREQEFLELLKLEMNRPDCPILYQAEGHRARLATVDATSAAHKAANKTAMVVAEAESVIHSQVLEKPVETLTPSTHPAPVATASTSRELIVKGVTWLVAIETTTDPAATEWLSIRDSNRSATHREIGILVSLSHPFTQRFGGATSDDIEGLIRVGVAICIAEVTAREAGVGMAGTIRRNVNELLGGTLAE